MRDFKELKLLLELLNDAVKDIENWSVYNDDRYNEEIANLVQAYEALKAKIES